MNIITDDKELNTYLEERLKVIPTELKKVLYDESFFTSLEKLLTEFGLSKEGVEAIQNEVRLILLHLEPLEDLSANLILEAELDVDTAIAIAQKIEKELLEELRPFLKNVPDDEVADVGEEEKEGKGEEENVKKEKGLPKGEREEYERLHLRPEGQERIAPGVKPLTREDVLNSLSPKRTMQSDIASIKSKSSETKESVPPKPPAPPKPDATGQKEEKENKENLKKE